MAREGLSGETQRWDLDTFGICLSSVFRSDSFLSPADGLPLLLSTPTEKPTPILDPYSQGSFWLAWLGSGYQLMLAGGREWGRSCCRNLGFWELYRLGRYPKSCLPKGKAWPGFFENRKRKRNLCEEAEPGGEFVLLKSQASRGHSGLVGMMGQRQGCPRTAERRRLGETGGPGTSTRRLTSFRVWLTAG